MPADNCGSIVSHNNFIFRIFFPEDVAIPFEPIAKHLHVSSTEVQYIFVLNQIAQSFQRCSHVSAKCDLTVKQTNTSALPQTRKYRDVGFKK